MHILLRGNIIIAHAPHIEYGEFEGEYKWGLFDKKDENTRNTYYYVIDHRYDLWECEEIPEDYEDGRYFFENGQFILNEEWQPPLPPAEERIAELELKVAALSTDSVWNEIASAIEEGVNDV